MTPTPAAGGAPTYTVAPASQFIGSAQPEQLVGTISGLATSVTISGRGAILCSGNYGELIAYDADHREVARTALQLIDPADCSPVEQPDNLTYGAAASVSVTEGGIASFVVTPMSPLDFPVLGTPGGKASQTYTIAVAGAPCALLAEGPGDDPLLGNPEVQKLFNDLAEQSNWDKPLAEQSEQGAFLVDHDGVIELIPWTMPFPPNPCLSVHGTLQRNDLVANGFKILAEIHTHPKHAEVEKDPGNCWTADAKGKFYIRKQANGLLSLKNGPSRDDQAPWEGPTSIPAYPGYVMDPNTNSIYRMTNGGPGTTAVKPIAINSCIGR